MIIHVENQNDTNSGNHKVNLCHGKERCMKRNFFLQMLAVLKKVVILQPKSQDSTKSHVEHLTELIQAQVVKLVDTPL